MDQQAEHHIEITTGMTAQQIHALLAKTLALPDHYGHNWDAFWDCIDDAEQCHLPDVLVIKGWDVFMLEHPKDIRKFWRCVEERSQLPGHSFSVLVTPRPCPCCAHLTLKDWHNGSFELCPFCGWEDDPASTHDPDFKGGANHKSLREARADIIYRNLVPNSHIKDFRFDPE